MGRDEFSGRLTKAPEEAYLEYYRRPKARAKLSHYWEPLLLLNRAQVVMLEEVDILDSDEASVLLAELDKLMMAGQPSLETLEEFEGPYLYIEHAIIDALGEPVGGKLHTGRSRNDLYSAAIRVAVRRALLQVIEALLDLRQVVLDRAEENTDVVMPAFTHSQPAQPITLAHYFLSIDQLLARDGTRLKRAFERTNRSPLGAAAIGGTGFPLDRERLAELSGFDEPIYNTYDAIASVDFVPETTFKLAILATNLSRISQDFLVWSMFETGFVELSDGLSSVSSIMPQKKNPSPLERTRAAAAEVIGDATAALTYLKAVPYGDVGETSYAAEPLLERAPDVVRSLRLITAVIETLVIHSDRMYEDAEQSFSTMTELADTLVRECGLSFRQAHEVVATLVQTLVADGRYATDVTPADLDEAAETTLGETLDLPADELRSALDPRENVARRDVVGGTAPRRNQESVEYQREELRAQVDWLVSIENSLEVAEVNRPR